jgi:DNA-binding MarR family transcriptional regulator
VSDHLTSAAEPGLEANLGYLFRLAHQRFRGALESRLRDVGLSAQEYGVLSVFEGRPELSTSDLARIAQVTRQTMHTVVNRLEAIGLLERSSRNQRVVLLRLTRPGRDRLRAATERVREVESLALAGLSRSDERALRIWLAGVAAMTLAPEARQIRTSRS